MRRTSRHATVAIGACVVALGSCGGSIEPSDIRSAADAGIDVDVAASPAPGSRPRDDAGARDAGGAASDAASDGPSRACVRVDEACVDDRECCTARCAAADGGRRCRSLSRCLLEGEACNVSAECCGGLCIESDGGGASCAVR